jgi:AAHS family 4-hydroxybenzoate transporter-like MFS transporter
MYAVYAFFSWAPLVLTSLGFELVTAVRGALVFNLAGIVGVIAVSWLIARLGSRRPLAVFAFAAACALIWLAWVALMRDRGGAAGLVALMSGIAAAGVAICAVQVGLYAVAAHVFPTECRSSGVGFSLGAGRTGGIAASLGGGVLLTMTGAAGFFAGIAAALLIAFLAVLLIRRQIAGRDSATQPSRARAAA